MPRSAVVLCLLPFLSCDDGRSVATDAAVGDVLQTQTDASHPDGPAPDSRGPDVGGDDLLLPDGMAQSCTDINAKYLDNLEKAKHCDARLPSTKCDHKVKDSLCGGCDTLVDPAQTAAVQQLASLAQQWDALSCSTVLACVMPKCQVPTGATCVYGGPGDCFGGCCVDTYP